MCSGHNRRSVKCSKKFLSEISAEVAGHGSVYCENGNTRNTEKLFSKRKETVLQKLFVGRRRAWPPGPVPRESCRKAEMDRKRWHTKQARRTGREGGTPARAATRKLEQFSSTTVLETATANSNPAIPAAGRSCPSGAGAPGPEPPKQWTR